MWLGYFTEKAYEKLLHDIERNAGKYASDDEWLDEYFGCAQDYYKQSKLVDVNEFTPYTESERNDSNKSTEDLTNTRLIYEAFRTLTPLQASNKYMWTYLCHAIPKYRDYIRNRWMTTERSNTIKTRFFVTEASSLINDNALSRLWWYGYLTYDKDSANHYDLTNILFINQTICTDVMDTLNRMNFNRIKGVLLAISEFKDKLGDNEGITDYFRECKKYLNHYAAVTTLDYLDADEIRILALDYMVKLRDQKDSKNRKKR